MNCEEDLDATVAPEPHTQRALPDVLPPTVRVPIIPRRAFQCPKPQLAPSLYALAPSRKRQTAEDPVPAVEKHSAVVKKQRTGERRLLHALDSMLFRPAVMKTVHMQMIRFWHCSRQVLPHR